MSRFFKSDPSKYPSRMGLKWDKEEVQKLLDSIRDKKSDDEIAEEHDRTVGGIRAYKLKLAMEYLDKGNDIEEVRKITGLTTTVIADAITKRRNREEIVHNTEKYGIEDVMVLLKDIQCKLDYLISR